MAAAWRHVEDCELYVKIKGNMKYLFAMMGDETRIRIAQMVATHKGTDDVRPMFRESIDRAGKKPQTLISDGANNFHEAWRKEMWSQFGESHESSTYPRCQVRRDGPQQQDGAPKRRVEGQGEGHAVVKD